MHVKQPSQLLRPADAAIDLARKGVSVMPVDPETKKPVGRWKDLQSSIADERTLKHRFAKPNLGVAVIGGDVSGNLEVLDFDCCGEAMDAWLDLLRERMPGVARHLIIELTPSGGFHVIYRCPAGIGRSEVLAMRVVKAEGPEGVVIARKHCPGYQDRETGEWLAKTVSIETRGEGGYCVCAPTPGYVLLCGDMKRIPVVNAEERQVLLDLARSFDEDKGREVRLGRLDRHTPRGTGDERPGDDFSRRGDIRPTLRQHGWHQTRGGTNEHWCRPGKDRGTSATLRDGVFFVFSSNAQPFEQNTAYSLFAVYTFLEHGGDFSAAAVALRRQGYAQPPQSTARSDPEEPPPQVFSAPISLGALIHDYPSLRPPVIHGILRETEIMNLIAAPKTGKSWLVNDLALAVAAGKPWLGHFETEQGCVLILDNELHPETSSDRIRRIAEARGNDLDLLAESVYFKHLRGELQDIHSLKPFFDSVKPGMFKVIVLDALYRFVPESSSENDNAARTGIYNTLEAIAKRLGCCIVIVHHTTKGDQAGKGVTDIGAGASAQSRAADAHVVLRPHKQQGVACVEAAVRSFEPFKPVCIRFEFPVWTVDESIQPSQPRTRGNADSGEITAENFVDRFVTDEHESRTVIIDRAVEAGIARSTADRVLRNAARKGVVNREGRGKAGSPYIFSRLPTSKGGQR